MGWLISQSEKQIKKVLDLAIDGAINELGVGDDNAKFVFILERGYLEITKDHIRLHEYEKEKEDVKSIRHELYLSPHQVYKLLTYYFSSNPRELKPPR